MKGSAPGRQGVVVLNMWQVIVDETTVNPGAIKES
jgi:hypothetical protein